MTRCPGLKTLTLPLLELPAVGPSQERASAFEFIFSAAPPEPLDADWLHHWRFESGPPNLSLARTGEGFLLRSPGLADFTISADGRRIGAWPAPDTSPETLRHLLLDQVLPRVLAHMGRLVLHGAAVRVADRAVAFMGESGQGKSTLTASFHIAGYPLLSDDGLVLTPGEDCTLALPTYPGLRLWPEAVAGLFAETPALVPMAHYASKQRVAVPEAGAAAGSPPRLAALYVLAPAGAAQTVSLTRLSPRDACMAIIGNAFQLDVTDRRRAVGLLAAAGDVAQQVPAFELSYPRDFASLPGVRAAILEQLAHH